MKIPRKFNEILENDQVFDVMVKGIIIDFEPILEERKNIIH